MSRYVDLAGKTWDGTPISSKIQEVETKHGYMQGITVGWLWGDNVPHIDLEEHDKQIYNQALDELAEFFHRDYVCDLICRDDCTQAKLVDLVDGFVEELKN